MGKKIYKYVGANYLGKVIKLPDGVTLKCSYPKDFNDPYELFLTIDFKQHPKILAFYSDVIGNIPQRPTTCFSRSPIIVPMWAHYAQNSEGIVIELDETMLAKMIPESGFGDIDYQDTPSPALKETLYRAFEIGKFRYLYLLQNGVLSAAYYTKSSYWSYEEERRMVVAKNEIRTSNGLMLLDVPKECITALICGSRASLKTVVSIRKKAHQLGCKYLEMKIGKNSVTPFFIDADRDTFIFTGSNIKQTKKHCTVCKEPLSSKSKKCSWCKLTNLIKLMRQNETLFVK